MISMLEAIEQRHSVRHFSKAPIETETREALQRAVKEVNAASGLNIRFETYDDTAFKKGIGRISPFKNVNNYLVMVGPDTPDLEEKVGYHGQGLVLLATQLGLDTCWAGTGYSRHAMDYAVKPGQRFVIAIAVGHGDGHGKPHTSKPASELADFMPPMTIDNAPEWFLMGMHGAMLAPTAMNQQKFRIVCTTPETAHINNLGGAFANVDLGIVRRNFEEAAGKENFAWV